MLLTHRFGSVETLSRARYWLTRHGFEIEPVDFGPHDATRLALNVDFSQAAAALALIDSIEGSDPDGWPGMYDQPKTLHVHAPRPAGEIPVPGNGSARSPIHWHHHHDEATAADPSSCKFCEYMLSRWE